MGLVLKVAGALEVFEPLFEGLVKTDDHGRGRLQTSINDGALSLKILSYGVLELAVTLAEVLSEDFGPSTSDPTNASGFEALCGVSIVELGVVGEIHELGDGESVELELIAVTSANIGEEVAVVAERQMRVEATVESREVAAKGEQIVQLGEDIVLLHDVAALLPRQPVEGAVVALGDADVGIVDNPHDHVRAGARDVETAADLCGESPELIVRGMLPEPPRIVPRDATAALDRVLHRFECQRVRLSQIHPLIVKNVAGLPIYSHCVV